MSRALPALHLRSSFCASRSLTCLVTRPIARPSTTASFTNGRTEIPITDKSKRWPLAQETPEKKQRVNIFGKEEQPTLAKSHVPKGFVHQVGYRSALNRGGAEVNGAQFQAISDTQGGMEKALQALANEFPIFMIAKSTCPFSTASKALLAQLGLPFVFMDIDLTRDLDLVPLTQAIAEAAVNLTGKTTVPIIWVNGKFIGGYEDLVKGLARGAILNDLKEKFEQEKDADQQSDESRQG